MNRRGFVQNGFAATGALLLISAGIAGGGKVVQGPPPAGGPLPGLTADQLAAFDNGRQVFQRNESPPTGLGPVFNARSCFECHRAGGPGGASTNIGVSRVTRIGGLQNGQYTDLEAVGGPVIQARSLREIIPGYLFPGEVVPAQAQFVSRRITTPLFGAGLIEAIPAATIIAGAQIPQPFGIQGQVNFITDPASGNLEVGRFGWKSQHSSLFSFSADAYLNEMGITTPLFPEENKPQGQTIPGGADPAGDPEDNNGDAQRLAVFMRFMAPAPGNPPGAQYFRGETLFIKLLCVNCHTPTMRTGPNPVAALSNKDVRLFSDLLLHRMGSGLADGIVQGQASGDQFRTAPLWGIAQRPFLMHDGRARTIAEAVNFHGGEASTSAARFRTLSRSDQTALESYLFSQ